jgi:hypothetical protein
MLHSKDASMFLDELFDTVRAVSQLEYKVDKIAKQFDKIYLESSTDVEEQFCNLRSKLAKIRLMLMSEDV